MTQHCVNLRARKHHRHAGAAPGPHHPVEFAELPPKHVPVEKQERVERLILRRACNPLSDRQVRQKAFRVLTTQVSWRLAPYESLELPHP